MKIGQQTFHYFKPLKKTAPVVQSDSFHVKSPHFGALVKYDTALSSSEAQELAQSFRQDSSVKWTESLPLPHINNAEVVVAFDTANLQNDSHYQKYLNNIVRNVDKFRWVVEIEKILEKIKNNQPLD
jgi:hypothetical protein